MRLGSDPKKYHLDRHPSHAPAHDPLTDLSWRFASPAAPRPYCWAWLPVIRGVCGVVMVSALVGFGWLIDRTRTRRSVDAIIADCHQPTRSQQKKKKGRSSMHLTTTRATHHARRTARSQSTSQQRRRCCGSGSGGEKKARCSSSAASSLLHRRRRRRRRRLLPVVPWPWPPRLPRPRCCYR